MSNKPVVDLDLSGLTMPEIDWSGVKADIVARESELDAYIEKYGEKEGSERYMRDLFADSSMDYDIAVKQANVGIYNGMLPMVTGLGPMRRNVRRLYIKRTHELYGDKYDELIRHERGDSRVVKLLLDDALQTGKWKELPDELQEEYKSLVGG